MINSDYLNHNKELTWQLATAYFAHARFYAGRLQRGVQSLTAHFATLDAQLCGDSAATCFLG